MATGCAQEGSYSTRNRIIAVLEVGSMFHSVLRKFCRARRRRNARLCFRIFLFSGLLALLYIKTNEIRILIRKLTTSLSPANEPMCKMFNLPIFNPEIMVHFKNVPPITCSEAQEDWVVNNGTHAFVTELVKSKHGPIKCKFYAMERYGDFKTNRSKYPIEGENFKFDTHDFVEAECSVPNTTGWRRLFLASPSASAFSNALNLNHLNEPQRLIRTHPQLNVLIYGLDSLSRNTFIRKLPNTYEYLLNSLKGHVLEGYNIVGDGRPHAIIPILTGKSESELPETRRRLRKAAKFVNIYPFVWKAYKASGYLTGYAEDSSSIGTFQFRLKGFDEPPTDFYMRPYYVAAEKSYGLYQKHCMGSVPRHKVMMNYVERVMTTQTDTPKFVFSFHSELSHEDINDVQGLDLDLKLFIENLQKSGVLNNTILILMSDYGHRSAALRETQQGKLEERLPIFLLVFPLWFQKIYPSAYKNFLKNTKVLSTPFDIHETLQDILLFDGNTTTDEKFKASSSIGSRGRSLFREIPSNRTCVDARIEPHWCACLQWRTVDANLPIVRTAGFKLLNFINNLTSSNRSICAELRLNKVLWAATLYPKDELMKFKKSLDEDGRDPDLSDSVRVSSVIFQLKIETTPGFGNFEASVTKQLKTHSYEIKEADISGPDRYKKQAKCEETEHLEYLSKYCYCV